MGDAAHVAPWSCSTVARVLQPVLQALLYASSTSPPQLQLWQKGLGDFGNEHRISVVLTVICAVFMARNCQHVGGAATPAVLPLQIQVPCPV